VYDEHVVRLLLNLPASATLGSRIAMPSRIAMIVLIVFSFVYFLAVAV
jgi:hypothetical protein